MQLSAKDVDYVRSVARRVVQSDDAAEDIVQESLLRAFVHREQFEGRASLRTWLYRITVNTAIAEIRRRQRSRLVFEEHDIPEEDVPTPEQRVSTAELGAVLQGELDKLAPMYRNVISLRYAEERTEPEVAEELGLTVATVKVRAHRARQRLRELMAA